MQRNPSAKHSHPKNRFEVLFILLLVWLQAYLTPNLYNLIFKMCFCFPLELWMAISCCHYILKINRLAAKILFLEFPIDVVPNFKHKGVRYTNNQAANQSYNRPLSSPSRDQQSRTIPGMKLRLSAPSRTRNANIAKGGKSQFHTCKTPCYCPFRDKNRTRIGGSVRGRGLLMLTR